MSFADHKLYIDRTSPDTAHMFGVTNFIKSSRTRFQQVEIADTNTYGRLLILDGKIQSAERDEYIYHEALVHPAMLMCPEPRRVLVMGGGEGATPREVFRHPSVEQVVMVDLDEEVVSLCREHLQSWHRNSFDDPRLQLLHMDARQYLEENDGQFDVIISDVPETIVNSPALRLFTRQFFELVKNRLAEHGIFALQAGDFGMPYIDAHSAIRHTLEQAMSFVLSYRSFISSFSTEWSYLVAAPQGMQMPDPSQVDNLIKLRQLDLLFFDGETCKSMFALPKDIRTRLASETVTIDDDHLLTSY
ncbi:MAG TPA: fused MFS/spermidine synthase [Candidatus Limnocylindrales bacterium]|nr:fused MFS/spermidine synthase [Candidatus Limnocylindrales bacterium]